MRTRWVIVAGVVLVGACGVNAQPAPLPMAAVPSVPLPPAAIAPLPAVPSVPGTAPPAPTQAQAPPLLPVPNPSPPLAEVPRPGPVPGVEYDPGYLYLPDRVAERRLGAPECGPPGRWWVSTSLELAWVPSRPAPADIRLRFSNPVAFGTIPGPVVPAAGRSAGRFNAALNLVVGHWFDEANTRGIEGSFFSRDASETISVAAPGAVVLLPPRGRGRGEFQILGFPSVSLVSAFPVTFDTYFATVDVNYRHRLYCSENARLDATVGYRYAFLGDDLYLGEHSDDGDAYRWNRASVSNNFHGAQIGVAGEARANGWYVSGSAKVALGATTSDVTTTGVFIGAEGLAGNGYRRLAGLTWAEQTSFAVLPSFNVQVGRQLTPHIRLFTGYSFAYLSRAARLGDALSPSSPPLNVTDFWVQSISLGADFRF